MGAPGSDLLAQIENEHPKLGIYLRRYVIPMIQSRGLAGHVLATPPDAPGDVQLQSLQSLSTAGNPKSETYVGTDATGAIVGAPTPGAGSVTAVSGTAPIGSTGGPTPNISVLKATSSAVGVVKPDNVTTTVALDGTISAILGAGNFATSEVLAGSGTAWTVAHTPIGTPLIVVMVAGFGGVVLLLGRTPGFTIVGTSVTTTNSYSAGEVVAWYPF